MTLSLPLNPPPPTIVMGVDPGFSGAIALYDTLTRSLVEVFDMPTIDDKQGRVQVDLTELSFMVDKYALKTALAVIEDVGARPGQGVTSMFRFGYSTGVVTGMIGSYLIPVHKTQPAVWKTIMKLSRDKQESIDAARLAFPKHAELFKLKKHADRAEAALLALFGERLLPLGRRAV